MDEQAGEHGARGGPGPTCRMEAILATRFQLRLEGQSQRGGRLAKFQNARELHGRRMEQYWKKLGVAWRTQGPMLSSGNGQASRPRIQSCAFNSTSSDVTGNETRLRA